MRNAFADEITKLSHNDDRIVLLSGDIGNRLFDKFKDNRNDRFYNCGVAEANMMGVAAGLALSGFRPVVYTIAPFATTRCYEQIRVDVCYHEAPVIIVGTGAGLSYAQLGPTHHSLEDISILRSLPGMTVFCPCDSQELRSGLRQALRQDGPIYIRLGKKGEPDIHPTMPDVVLGKSITVREGSEICILSTGNVMELALSAADALQEKEGISTRVDSFHTVKPLDEACLQDVFGRFKAVAVVEEHSVIGGLFGAVSEWYARQSNLPTQFIGFSLKDQFYPRVGSQTQIRAQGGLTREHILESLTRVMS